MISLFTTFDCYFFNFSTLVAALLIVNVFNSVFSNSFNNLIFNLLNQVLADFFYTLNNNNFSKNIISLIISLFITVLLINTFSITPFFFTWTSQISIVLFFSMTMWLSFIIIQAFNSSNNLISHFIPTGAPYGLVPFLFLIEVVSSIIRPLTVSVRLVANIIAGHLLMVLLSQLTLNFEVPIILMYTCLNIVEIAVAIIQSYIFCTIMCLYYSEVI